MSFGREDESGAKTEKTYGRKPEQRKFLSGGLGAVPEGAQMIPVEVKQEYDTVPFHIYHPNPYDAITVLRHRRDTHVWLVCGWYLDTFRDAGHVKGLVYKAVSSDSDKEFVLSELKKHDKEAVARFSLEPV